jgi:hypothetical protein
MVALRPLPRTEVCESTDREGKAVCLAEKCAVVARPRELFLESPVFHSALKKLIATLDCELL